MTVTALFLFDGACPDESVTLRLAERGVVVRTTNSLAQAMNLVHSPYASHIPTAPFNETSTMTSNPLLESGFSSSFRLIVAEVSAGGISLAEYVAEQYGFPEVRPCMVLLDHQQDIGAARRALRLGVDAYLLNHERGEQNLHEIDRVITKATTQALRIIPSDAPKAIRNGWSGEHNTKSITARLSTIENAIMTCLANQVGLPVSAKSIVSMVMGRDLDEDKAASLLRPHISRLRSKLEPMPQMPQHLLTVRGKGYMVV